MKIYFNTDKGFFKMYTRCPHKPKIMVGSAKCMCYCEHSKGYPSTEEDSMNFYRKKIYECNAPEVN